MNITNHVRLGGIYQNANGHRLQPYHFTTNAGRINTRVHCHNFTTGYDEAWSVRLFLAEHSAADEGARA